jgi:hypothetical protein
VGSINGSQEFGPILSAMCVILVKGNGVSVVGSINYLLQNDIQYCI